MAFIPKYLNFHLAIGLILQIVQGKNDISLGVEFKPSRYEEIAVQKSSLTLNCSVTSTDPTNPLSYIWQKDGLPLNSPRIELLNNGSLYFKKIRKNKKWNDEGVYQCIATNNIGSVLAPAIRIKIKSIAKNFSKEPTPRQGYLGGVTRFECNINSVPQPSYVWQKDGNKIPQDNRYTTFSSGVLQITNLKYEDAGLYQCMAYISGIGDGSDSFRPKYSKEAQLTVQNSARNRHFKMLAPPQNITGISGESAVLECLIDGYPLPGVIWTRKDKKSISGQRYGWGNLKFYKLAGSDEGTYICSSNSSNPQVSSEAHLKVLRRPLVKKELISQEWPISRHVIFICELDGVPKPNVTWYFNGQHYLSASVTLDLRVNKLVVLSANPDHSGYYQCVGDNGIGQVMSTGLLKVYKKEGSPEPPTNVRGTVLSDSKIQLTWSPVSTKLLTYLVTYYPISDDPRIDNIAVSVTNITIDKLEAFTDYSLSVKSVTKSGASLDSPSIILQTFEYKPYVAPEITLDSTQSDNIVVEWDEIPRDLANGIIVNYKIFYRQVGYTGHHLEIPATHKSYIIPDLQPDTEYEVRVLAATKIGYPDLRETEWPWVRHRVPKYPGPSGPPTPRFWLSFVNSTTATFMWDNKKPLDSDREFDLTVRNPVTDVILADLGLKSSDSSYTISNLENHTIYEVTFKMRNSNGQSSPITKEFSTSDEGVPTAPENVMPKVISSSMVLLSWREERPVDEYEVCFYPISREDQFKCIESVTTNAKITNLTPFTRYGFKVRPKLPDDQGEFSAVVTVKTKQDVPSAPTNITWEIVSPGIVELHWHPPTEPNGVITSYIIFYNIDESLPDTKWNNVTQNGVVTKARVDELTANSYYVKLSACTEAGQGGPSKIITVYPRPCVKGQQSSYPCTPQNDKSVGNLTGQQVGIIVGVTIGILCIIICILVIVFRRKCFYNEDHHSPPPPIYHGNGHIPQNGNGHVPRSSEHIPMDVHDADAFTPMLTTLTENEQSDSKGGGMMIVTPNGVKIRGFSTQNGHIANGHVPSYTSSNNSQLDVSSNKEEHHGLIAAMLAATDGSLTGEGSDTPATSSSFNEGEMSASLDDINHSVGSEEDINNLQQQPQIAATSAVHPPTIHSYGDPCLIEAATPVVITDTGQSSPHTSPQSDDSLLLRNKHYHQSTTTSPTTVNMELPPPPPDPPSCSHDHMTSSVRTGNMSSALSSPNPGHTLNSLPLSEINIAPHQIHTTVRDGRTVSAAKNSHSVV